MSNKPSTLLPAAAQAIEMPDAFRGFVAGMVNPDTGTVEVVQLGDLTEDGLRVGGHFQTGSQRFEGFLADLSDLKLFKLTPVLATAGRAYRAALLRDRGPVPPCPKGRDATAWLVAHNCD